MATDTRGPQIAAITYVFLILSTIATLLRVYCRGRVIKAFAMDDWLAVVAQVGFGSLYVDDALLTPNRYSLLSSAPMK
jgi:hypothetical protein